MNLSKNRKYNIFFKVMAIFVILTFSSSLVTSPQSYAQVGTVLNLSTPGAMVAPSSAFAPMILKGIKIYPDNPFKFDFIIDPGYAQLKGEALKQEMKKLTKYFLAALTTPEDDIWVNLSPYERDRIIPNEFGQTEMGRDLLAQDYQLKQLTASLIYPENELGKKFWDRIYAQAYKLYGTTEIPTNTFNKVWITPDRAVVYTNGDTVFIKESHLKVMLEEDYVARQADTRFQMLDASALSGIQNPVSSIQDQNSVSSEIIRELIIPAIEKEVNEGKTFDNLRQIFNSIILATWYKQNLKESLLGQVYVDQNKIKGVELKDSTVNQRIYDQYVKAFEKGVFNYIKEDIDPATQQIIPRKYFSGGVTAKNLMLTAHPNLPLVDGLQVATMELFPSTSDRASSPISRGDHQASSSIVPKAEIGEDTLEGFLQEEVVSPFLRGTALVDFESSLHRLETAVNGWSKRPEEKLKPQKHDQRAQRNSRVARLLLEARMRLQEFSVESEEKHQVVAKLSALEYQVINSCSGFCAMVNAIADLRTGEISQAGQYMRALVRSLAGSQHDSTLSLRERLEEAGFRPDNMEYYIGDTSSDFDSTLESFGKSHKRNFELAAKADPQFEGVFQEASITIQKIFLAGRLTNLLRKQETKENYALARQSIIIFRFVFDKIICGDDLLWEDTDSKDSEAIKLVRMIFNHVRNHQKSWSSLTPEGFAGLPERMPLYEFLFERIMNYAFHREDVPRLLAIHYEIWKQDSDLGRILLKFQFQHIEKYEGGKTKRSEHMAAETANSHILADVLYLRRILEVIGDLIDSEELEEYHNRSFHLEDLLKDLLTSEAVARVEDLQYRLMKTVIGFKSAYERERDRFLSEEELATAHELDDQEFIESQLSVADVVLVRVRFRGEIKLLTMFVSEIFDGKIFLNEIDGVTEVMMTQQEDGVLAIRIAYHLEIGGDLDPVVKIEKVKLIERASSPIDRVDHQASSPLSRNDDQVMRGVKELSDQDTKGGIALKTNIEVEGEGIKFDFPVFDLSCLDDDDHSDCDPRFLAQFAQFKDSFNGFQEIRVIKVEAISADEFPDFFRSTENKQENALIPLEPAEDEPHTIINAELSRFYR